MDEDMESNCASDDASPSAAPCYEPYTCDDCDWIEQCSNEFGELRGDGDDYRAVIGTHFCRRSWENFKCNCGS